MSAEQTAIPPPLDVLSDAENLHQFDALDASVVDVTVDPARAPCTYTTTPPRCASPFGDGSPLLPPAAASAAVHVQSRYRSPSIILHERSSVTACTEEPDVDGDGELSNVGIDLLSYDDAALSVPQLASNRLGAGASGSVHALTASTSLGEGVAQAVKVVRETSSDRADAATREVAFAERVKELRDAACTTYLSPTTRHGHSGRDDDDDEDDASRVVSVFRVRREPAAGETTVMMELLPGTTVADIPALQLAPAAASALQSRVRERALRDVARDALRGLRHLHDTLRVVHRDIKPSNLLLDHDGRVKIADFGMAAVLSRVGGDIATGATDQVGTLAYLSPERLRGEPHGAPGDVWALGVTLVQLALGGTHPLQWPPADARAPPDLGHFFHVAAAFDALDDRNGAAADMFAAQSPPAVLTRALDGAGLSRDARELLLAMMRPAPAARPTAAEALSHPWLV